jgi:hypothetical protein
MKRRVVKVTLRFSTNAPLQTLRRVVEQDWNFTCDFHEMFSERLWRAALGNTYDNVLIEPARIEAERKRAGRRPAKRRSL